MQDRFSADKVVAVNVQRSLRSEEPTAGRSLKFLSSNGLWQSIVWQLTVIHMFILALFIHFIEIKKKTRKHDP